MFLILGYPFTFQIKDFFCIHCHWTVPNYGNIVRCPTSVVVFVKSWRHSHMWQFMPPGSSFALSVPWLKVKSSICRTTFAKFCGASWLVARHVDCVVCFSLIMKENGLYFIIDFIILFPYWVTLLRLFPCFLNANVHQSNLNQEMSPIIKYNCLAFNSNM